MPPQPTIFQQLYESLIAFPRLLSNKPSEPNLQGGASSSSSSPDSATGSGSPLPCSLPLDNASSATFTLPDGRKLGYAQYGDLAGQPIIYVHGWPGSRFEGAHLDPAASKVGARIIAVDHPGIGQSSPQPGRKLLDHAKDIERLTDHLGLSKYGVLGISGGGPYALACARGLPADKLKAVSIVCGLGSPDMGYAGMNLASRLGWTYGFRLLPGFSAWWIGRWPEGRTDLSDEERKRLLLAQVDKAKSSMHDKDLKIWDNPDFVAVYLRSSRESFAQGAASVVQDAAVICTSSSWGFRIENIRMDLPVQLWHGRFDNMVPLQHGQKVAERLGKNATLRVKDETHASISVYYKEEYLGELVKAIKGS
ncbi:hypothetical protein ABEF95_012275 [Exophiala dermatitidis]